MRTLRPLKQESDIHFMHEHSQEKYMYGCGTCTSMKVQVYLVHKHPHKYRYCRGTCTSIEVQVKARLLYTCAECVEILVGDKNGYFLVVDFLGLENHIGL